MSTSSVAVDRRAEAAGRLADYLQLTKPRIAMLILVTVSVAAFVGSWGQPHPLRLLHALVGTLLVAGSASALNQWLERRSDARMRRTADRPLPAGRLSASQALCFGVAMVLAGEAWLLAAVNWQTAAWGLLTWLLYVGAYTPLKSRTSWNTTVGAVAGALPMLMGWSAVGASLDVRAFALFLILFLWQFPHFMAIAWMYRRQYDGAGLKMLTTVDPSGRRAGVQAVVASLALLPVSFIPVLHSPAAGLYMAAALLLGAVYLGFSLLFLARLDDRSARLLLRASLLYLPALLALLVCVPLA